MKLLSIIVLSFVCIQCYSIDNAICINGNLKKLELGSKITNLIIPNLISGHNFLILLLLDDSNILSNSSYYKKSPYSNYTVSKLKNHIESSINSLLTNLTYHSFSRLIGKYSVDVRFEANHYHYSLYDETITTIPSDIFQSTIRHFSSIRSCALWVEDIEVDKNYINDYFIRLRDDTYISKPWILNESSINKRIVVSSYGSTTNGINDRWFLTDRLHVDKFVRGLVEHYYLYNEVVGNDWQSSEDILHRIITKFNLPILRLSICELPIVTVKHMHNSTHWLIDHSILSNINNCEGIDKLDLLRSGVVDTYSIDLIES